MEREFIPINIAVLTVSDTRTLENDTSGGYIVQRMTEEPDALLDALRAFLGSPCRGASSGTTTLTPSSRHLRGICSEFSPRRGPDRPRRIQVHH